MVARVDETDLRLLRQLQIDAALSLDRLADAVGMSRNACWRRVKALEESGVVRARVALLDAEKLELDLTVFVMVKAKEHNAEWLEDLRRVVRQFPEIVGAYRMTGELDYLLRVQVKNVAGYDQFYKRLVTKLDLADVSASFVMESIKDTTALPI